MFVNILDIPHHIHDNIHVHEFVKDTGVQINTTSQIGKLIRSERKRQGLLQRDLAELCGVSWHFLSNLENGKNTVEFSRVLRVLTSLGIEMELVTRAEALDR